MSDNQQANALPNVPEQTNVQDEKKDHQVIDVKQEKKKGLTLTFKDVNFSVPVKVNGKSDTKQLLNGVSGTIKPGQVIAIMGASGSGKTTLLNVLAGRIGAGTLSGEITINGKPRVNKTWKRIVAYVEQDDLLLANLTVRETLTYAALLRLPRDMKYETKIKRVNEVISLLGLAKCENTFIGDSELRGISGGERKRVSIGIELVTNPSLLFLDEPTSGLDAFTAAYIIETIKTLAREKNATVLLTIHQPREYIMALFDSIILLSAGNLVFFGNLKDATQHFANCGFPVPANTNPSDHFLDIMSVDYRSTEKKEQCLERIKLLQKSWPKEKSNALNASSDLVDEEEFVFSNNTLFYEFWILLHRNLIDIFRNKTNTIATVGQAVVNCLIVGFIFFQIKNDQSGAQNRIGSLFMITIQMTFGNVMPTLAVFVLQQQIMKRERASGTYRAITAYLARVVSQIPLTLLGAILTSIPVYWLVGLVNDSSKYGIFIATIVVHALASAGMGICIASGISNIRVGQIIAPTITTIFLIFGGALVDTANAPASLGWIKWVSVIKYTFSALAQNELTGFQFNCSGGAANCPATGDILLESFHLTDVSIGISILSTALIGIGFVCLGFLLFNLKSKPLMRLK